MLLLVGLGNPGARYAGNRHNVGFTAIEEIARRRHLTGWREKFHGLILRGQIDHEDVLLLLPGTFMNDSGRAVAAAMRASGLTLGDVTVFHDEIELHPAYVKVKVGGGNAGHNGLRSITAAIGNDYRRVCIGVGRPPDGEEVDHYVLRSFENTEHSWVDALLTIVADNVGLLVRGEDKRFEDTIRREMLEAGFKDLLSHSSSRPKKTKSRQEPPTRR
jgi:PTH1 family peptidyl-tRNA hydrolase